MKIEVVIKNNDHSGPVLDIYYEDIKEAFLVGRIFEQLVAFNMAGWLNSNNNYIRIPLVKSLPNGLAETYEEDRD